MRHLFLILGILSLTGCFMNPDPFEQERQQSLTGRNVQTAEQQEVLRHEEDLQRRQAEMGRQERIRQREQAQEQEQQTQIDQPVVGPSGRRQLRPQIRTTPRPGTALPQSSIVTPVRMAPVPAR